MNSLKYIVVIGFISISTQQIFAMDMDIDLPKKSESAAAAAAEAATSPAQQTSTTIQQPAQPASSAVQQPVQTAIAKVQRIVIQDPAEFPFLDRIEIHNNDYITHIIAKRRNIGAFRHAYLDKLTGQKMLTGKISSPSHISRPEGQEDDAFNKLSFDTLYSYAETALKKHLPTKPVEPLLIDLLNHPLFKRIEIYLTPDDNVIRLAAINNHEKVKPLHIFKNLWGYPEKPEISTSKTISYNDLRNLIIEKHVVPSEQPTGLVSNPYWKTIILGHNARNVGHNPKNNLGSYFSKIDYYLDPRPSRAFINGPTIHMVGRGPAFKLVETSKDLNDGYEHQDQGFSYYDLLKALHENAL